MRKIAVLSGDGVGPEVIDASMRVLNATADGLEFVHADIGMSAYSKHEQYLPSETLDAINECEAILMGTIIDKRDDRLYRSPNLALKKQLGLFANIRPFAPLCDDIGFKGIDTIMVRENSEGMYTMAEIEDLDGVTLERRVSIKGCRRICRMALKMASLKGRKKITCAHKANVFTASDGLFKDIFYEEMTGSPYAINDVRADKLAAEYILTPGEIDLVVTLNLYGDIISEEVSALVGGTYLTPSGNLGDDMGLFEPMHSAQPDLAGQDRVNPTSSILSAAMMLDFLGMKSRGDIIRRSVREAYAKMERTADVGGSMGTRDFAERVAKYCEAAPDRDL